MTMSEKTPAPFNDTEILDSVRDVCNDMIFVNRGIANRSESEATKTDCESKIAAYEFILKHINVYKGEANE